MSDRSASSRRVQTLRAHLAGGGGSDCGGDCGSAAACAGPSSSPTSSRIRCAGNHAMPFEAWKVGQLLETKCRTINDADIINYTHLTGYDAENLFGDMEYLRNVAGHKRRLAPGLLTASIADALIVGSGILEGYAVALVSLNDVVAKAPVYGGDTLQVLLEVTESKPSKSKPDRGFVTTSQQVINQDGTVVMEYKVTRLLRRSK
ncbi:Hypothetical Protein FCC1311_085212 [Hondaea fermentalgiana]|uniref:MaoC-like domain-containing protein n=1 Tax=Hondaea fermentalgiana TaxID=2315210 RepID=A0A2R5GN31_9STRA|nr:Hypothetical Protein FCC1311_085212 [Hondaea fermentalgiana]|eukprot:GBG32296.1 Hypothetical Protein FCC1311_085212 [Hondaea fermentalgiana]